MVKNKLLFALLVFFALAGRAQNNARFVDVFVGTDGTGHTFPGPSMPFGMVQPGPDNRSEGWDYTSGYQYRDEQILGFSQTRLSGTGIPELGDVLLFPFAKENDSLSHRYAKESEQAAPGYYRLQKHDGVEVELTATQRVALHRYTFPDAQAHLLVDFQHGLRFLTDSLVLESAVRIESPQRVSGYCRTRNWVERQYHFVLAFDQPFLEVDTLAKAPREHAPRFVFRFDVGKARRLQVKVALSTVDTLGARQNMEHELPHWQFDTVRQAAYAAWNELLNRIDIEAPAAQKTIFYTALYHLLLQPADVADTDGRYRGANQQVARSADGAYYSTLSVWDIYRGAWPLLQWIVPERIDAICNSLLAHHRAAGFLPIWTVWGQDNYCMIGNHAIPMLLSAYENGFRGFDAQAALQAMVETSRRSHINSDWTLYEQYGYYPFDRLDNEAVSRTLESGYDDWCVAQLAQKLGQKQLADSFVHRAGFYRNLFDGGTGMLRGRNSKGEFRNPFDPFAATSPMNNPGDYTEANAWQYLWTPAQHDLMGLARLLGGEPATIAKLDSFFSLKLASANKHLGQEALIGQYAHGNEPGHHVPYLYALLGRRDKTSELVGHILNQFYQPTPDGLLGNDDCGQMSAWYILSSLGFYPINPANGEFVLGSPQVNRAVVRVPNCPPFEIQRRLQTREAPGSEPIWRNNARHTKPVITFSELRAGGKLSFGGAKP